MKLIEFLKEITTNPDWDKSNILWDAAIETAEQKGAIGIEDIIDWHEVWPALGNLIQFIERGVFDDYKENKNYNENINPYRDHFGGFHDTEGYYEDEE